MNLNHVEEVAWEQISSNFAEVDKEGVTTSFAKVFQPLSSSKKTWSLGQKPRHLFVARYPYGSLLVDNGEFLPPCGKNAQCSDCKNLIGHTKYSYIPLGIVLNNCIEVFVVDDPGYGVDDRNDHESKKRIIPIRLLSKGEMFGVFETLDKLSNLPTRPRPFWSVSAGARSVSILAPIGNRKLLQDISRQVGRKIPDWNKNRDHHWQLIQGIAQTLSSNWETKVLIFPEWIKEINPISTGFHEGLFKIGWAQSAPLRNYAFEEANISEDFLKNLPGQLPNPSHMYFYSTIRHILSIARGDMPAFHSVVPGVIEAGPFSVFQNALQQTYRKGIPVVLQPCHLTKSQDLGYYSLRKPTLLGMVPKDAPVKTFNLFINLISDALRNIVRESRLPYLSVAGIQVFGEDSYKAASELLFRDGLPENSPPLSFSPEAPFVKAIVRIIRN